VGCSDEPDGGERPTPSSTTTSGGPCVTPSPTEDLAGLSLELIVDDPCGSVDNVALKVTNRNLYVCNGDGRAALDGVPLIYVAEPGSDVDFGTWMEPTGDRSDPDPVSYPQGERLRPVELPDLDRGEHRVTLSVSCQDLIFELTARFRLEP
jgi:hypothetical protein